MKKSIRGSLIGATALTAMAFIPGLVSAQTPAAQTTPSTSTSKAPPKTAETVIVTGSRIRRDTFTTASPLTVITNENAVLAGSIDATEILQGSTAAAGSGQINNFFTGFLVDGGPGIQTVGLNSLGAQRTLVLLNGRRMPPSGVGGSVGPVDLNIIPNLAISRYEIVNEGASPIYGSDAVGGVVNGIIRKNVNGFEARGATSASFDGGGNDYTLGALWGKTEDRWNVMVSGEYFKQDAFKYGDRDFCSANYVFDADTGKRADFIDPKTGKPRCFGFGGSVNRIIPQGNAATGTGSWVADASQTARRVGRNPSTGAPDTLLAVPGWRRVFSPPPGQLGEPVANQLDYGLDKITDTDIISPSDRAVVYATVSRDLDLLGGVEVYGEFLGANRKSTQTRYAQLFFFGNVPGGLTAFNIFNPFSTPTTPVAAQPVILRPFTFKQNVGTYQALGGLRGKTDKGIFGGFKNGDWDVYVQSSLGEGKYTGSVVYQDRLEASLQATRDPLTGALTCPSPILTGGNCVPINFFDPRVVAGNLTPVEEEYLFADPRSNKGKTTYKQTVVEANMTGDFFRFPSASDDVKINLGMHYRKMSLNDVPGVITLQQIRPGVSNSSLVSTAGITKGKDSVWEAYTEISAPLMAKKPMVESLNVLLAYRYTDYDSYDSNSTWKATIDWRIVPEISLIGITGTSYRAPGLYELFLGDQTGFLGQSSVDPCIQWGQSTNQTLADRCKRDGVPPDYTGSGSSAQITRRGGKGVLKEETSKSNIISLVYRPSKIDLNLRLDFWQISVSDQIGQFGAANIVNTCYTDTSGRADTFCKLFTRDTNKDSPRFNNILNIFDSFVNINETNVEGIDLKFVYRKSFAIGDLTVDSQHRWTTKNATGIFTDDELEESQGTIGDPIYNSITQFRFKRQDWTYAWTVTAIGPSNQIRFFNDGNNIVKQRPGDYYSYNGLTSVFYKTKTETTITHAIAVQYKSDNWTIVGGISNIFNDLAPAISTGVVSRLGVNPLTSQYDIVGRSLTLDLVRRF
ncbi:TonB-dependent receptor domain-containing protein [Candidatus Phycosocius spiralis]|uniref:TonB-dependent receptor n=1 Tax=Candidatus Phycosocius spiralis TaxID=2815099 RepID=A0ABQ4PV95_9PROT|nr:TonB-dependent receptor [Candidatus Phycosocius spiralis]GIU66886.1 TonB-dependent receptor [Candidatus Phycosocius spiralis]